MLDHPGAIWVPTGGSKGPLWPQTDPVKLGEKLLSAPEGSALVPPVANWSDLAGTWVSTHFGLVSGLFWATRNPKMTHFGP